MSPPTKDGTFGALYICQSFSLILYGWAMHQAYRYFRMYPQDNWIIKAWVIAIMLVETLGSAFMFHTCYFFLITNGSRLEGLTKDVWSFRMAPVTAIAAVVLAQCFYARRVFHLSNQFKGIITVAMHIIVAVSLFLILTEMGIAIACTVITFLLASVDKWSKYAWLIGTLFGFALAADVLLTSTLIYVLLQGRTGFRSTDSMLDTLIIYSINTGLVTSIFGILAFVLSLTEPAELYYSGFALIGAKMYSNCFLAMLNSRKALGSRVALVDDFETGGLEMEVFSQGMHTDFLVARRMQDATTVSINIKGSSIIDIGGGRSDGGDVEDHPINDGHKGAEFAV